ncbi:CoA transferase [Alicycliphilus denitrificans]|nr:CoA transferase [Alicycliphilus denitrificans]
MCNVVMGPYATQILAQYGADVVKVEPPEGDDARRTGALHEPNMASLFLGVNRGKRSVVLDLKSPHARSHLESLVRDADVLVHNIRPQKLNALGIDPESVMRTNPRIVYAMLTGFGQSGPYGGRPAYDDVIQGMSGLAELGARHCGGLPRYMPTIAADKTVGILAASAILAALMKQQREGVGSVVEVPMFESMVAYSLVEHMHGAHFHGGDGPMGYPRALAPWRKPFSTRDGYVCVMPYTDRHWQGLLNRLGSPELAADPRFCGIAQRSLHSDYVYRTLGSLLACHATDAILAILAELEIPATPVVRPEDLPHDPHLKAVGFFQHVQDAGMGAMCFPGVPLLFDGVRPQLAPPPRLGQHTREILGENAANSPACTAVSP